ncbi:MAG: DUF1549 domain-containing protein [Kiritimatiellae bacterium]|nr:DUF1549 domain-containing protein [Kiritimatiellia bacterium]
MHVEIPRRAFIAGSAAFAAWPRCIFADDPARVATVWENPDGTATDAVMVRRLHLDLAGRIPTKDEAQAYVASKAADKRAALVDRLLASTEFADYWAMRFCDVLRVKSEFPINLWPNAVYVYHARIRKFGEGNEPWDEFGRALLTSQGSDFRDAEVNFFRATDRRTPEGWAEAAAQTFLGIPPESLSSWRRGRMAKFFAGLQIKTTREWKEEIVFVEGRDRRAELCDDLFVKRRAEVEAAFRRLVRGWIFGPDAKADSVGGSLGLKDVVREAVLSGEYARGSVTGGFPARRIDAEVLDDIICTLGGGVRNYQSPAPEPFTFLPGNRRTVCVEDGSISSSFLTLFGRPARDTGLPGERISDVTSKQRLYLFNSGRLHGLLGRVAQPGGWKNNPLVKLPLAKRVDDLYWRVLSREPSAEERRKILGLWERRGGWKKGAKPYDLLRDLSWCLFNTKEFLFRI